MKALILASGLGTRLHPITKIKPKSLVDVKGKPIIQHIIEKLEKSRYIEEINVVYSSKFHDQFYEFFGKLDNKKKLEFKDKHRTHEELMPGSIGTIAYFIKHKGINEDLLVLGGDNLFDFDIDEFIEFFKKHNETCIAVRDFKDKKKVANRFGVVEIDKKNKIISFEEKPKNPKTSLAATLCYIISNYDLHHLDKKTFKENAGELIIHLVEHENVYAYVFRGRWFDIGTHEDLARARKEF